MADLVDVVRGHMGVLRAPYASQSFARWNVVPDVIMAPDGAAMEHVGDLRYEQVGEAPRGRHILNLIKE